MAKTKKPKRIYYTIDPTAAAVVDENGKAVPCGWVAYCPLDDFPSEPLKTFKEASTRARLWDRLGLCLSGHEHEVTRVYQAKAGGRPKKELPPQDRLPLEVQTIVITQATLPALAEIAPDDRELLEIEAEESLQDLVQEVLL